MNDLGNDIIRAPVNIGNVNNNRNPVIFIDHVYTGIIDNVILQHLIFIIVAMKLIDVRHDDIPDNNNTENMR